MRWWRREPLSVRDRVALESAAVERYKRHVDIDRLIEDLREQRDEVERLHVVADALEGLLRQASEHLPAGELAETIAQALGPEPAPIRITPIVVTPTGEFVSVRA